MLMVPMVAQAESALPAPNWDRELALQTARLGVDQSQVEKWFSLLRGGDQAGLLQAITSYIQSADSSSPIREQALYEFTQGLADFSATAIPASLLNLLASYTPQTLVANEENFTSAVPLFNIPAAAQGVKHAFERQQGESRSAELLANRPQDWVVAYLAASAPERGGFIDALDGAPIAQLQAIGNLAMERLQHEPALLPAAARAALASKSREAVEQVLLTGHGPELTNILQDVARDFSLNDQALLLLSMIENAPAENASLAIALLTPGLQQVPAVADTLFDLLGDAALGSSAALALSNFPDSAVDARLKALAASEGAGANRARLARELATNPRPSGASQ